MAIWRTTHPLYGAFLKTVRAQDHLDVIRRKIEPLGYGDCEVTIEQKDDPNGGGIRLVTEEPGPDLAVVIGDFLFCLLSALDHIVWALVIANPPNKPSTRNQFPICSCHCNFRGELKKGRLDGLSDIALTAVEGLQPYKAGHNLLGLLNGLHNIDKHRRLNVTTVSIDSLIFEWREKGVPVMDYRLTGDGPTNGAELLQGAIAHGLSGGDVKVSGKATGSVLFKDEPGRDLDVLPILEEMLDYFKDSVFPTFEPLFS